MTIYWQGGAARQLQDFPVSEDVFAAMQRLVDAKDPSYRN
jgi:hypothetical protein